MEVAGVRCLRHEGPTFMNGLMLLSEECYLSPMIVLVSVDLCLTIIFKLNWKAHH